MTSETDNTGQDVVYSYRPSLLGAPWEFKLTSRGIQWTAGNRSGEVPYSTVRYVRLSYRPAKMQAHRYFTEVWADGVPPLRIASASWRSMFVQEPQDERYAAFVTALHQRLAQADAPAVYVQGMIAAQYWTVFALFAVVTISVLALAVRALLEGMFGGAAFIVAFLALFGWQSWNLLGRNRPGTYRPETPPPLLVPVKR